MFEPREQREMPITFERLLGQRTTTIEYEDGHVETIDDNWLTSANPTRCAPRGLWWRGTTKIRHKPLIDEPFTARRPMTTTATNHETREQPSTPPGLEPNHEYDYWENVDGKWKQHHVKPRTRLYRPGAEQRPNEQGPPQTLVRGRRTIIQFTDGSMMEHHDDWTKRDDELENETRKWTGITEFFNRDESEEVQELIPDDPEQLRETQPARGLLVPRQPSQHEREEHELTHLPPRAWCETCVAAKARQAYHMKQPDRRDCLQLVFCFLTEGNRHDAVLVVTDARTGCCAALLCETKHTTETLIRFVLSFIYETGRTHTPIQKDDEEATQALAKAVSRRIGIPTFTSPGYSSRSLGHTERFIQTLWTQLRTLRTQMGDKYSKLQIPTTHPIVGWAIRHASWILTRYLLHADGKTSYKRQWQRPYASPLCIFGETAMYAEQTKVLPKHAIRFNSGIWVGRCTTSNAHLVVDGSKLFRTRTVRRFPEGPERWNHEKMQRFAVNVANPTPIPDIPSRRRDVSEHDELDERLYEREHAERQRHVRFDDEPSRTESDRHKKRKRDLDDNGISVRRKYDEEGDAEFAELLLDDGLMMTRTTDTFDPQYIGHDEWILQEPYVEPIQVFPILHEPKLDATRTGGLNEELVSKAMKAEMESFRKFDVYDEVDINDLTPEERSKIIGGRWVIDTEIRYRCEGTIRSTRLCTVC